MEKWDCFISYASEDYEFASKVAAHLRAYKVDVWFDQFELNIGDSILEKINLGLAKSRYGIVIITPRFLDKKWPQRELAALFAKETGNDRIILPIWHGIPFRAYIGERMPILLDIVALRSEDYNIDSLSNKIISIIKKDLKFQDQNTFSIHLKDESEMIILPIQPENGYAFSISKHPITNKQFKDFTQSRFFKQHVEGFFGKEPIGKKFFRDGNEIKWIDNFYPWHEENFNLPELPVVCVDFRVCMAYTQYVNWLHGLKPRSERLSWYYSDNEKEKIRSYCFIPTPELWDIAAFGEAHPYYKKIDCLNYTKEVHHKSNKPISVFDQNSSRTNIRGVTDMIGNVWEWCAFDGSNEYLPVFGLPEKSSADPIVELRGGAFNDDMSRVSPFLTSRLLENNHWTKHYDLGFRIAALVNVKMLPKELVLSLFNDSGSIKDFRFLIDDIYYHW